MFEVTIGAPRWACWGLLDRIARWRGWDRRWRARGATITEFDQDLRRLALARGLQVTRRGDRFFVLDVEIRIEAG